MIPSALTERWQGMFCADELSKKFDLEYWDCSSICKPFFEASSVLDRSFSRKIIDFSDMESQLSRLPQDTVIISHIHLEGFNYKLHKLISSYNRNRVYVDFWANRITAFLESSDSANNRRKEIRKNSIWSQLLKRAPFLDSCVKFVEYKGGPEYRKYRDEHRKLQRYYKAVPLYNRFLISVKPHMRYSINHPDYEKFLSVVQDGGKALVEGRYAVFLDQCFPRHPSLKTENPDIDFEALAQPYYSSLNAFFDKIEKEFKCRVVIAGHPVANYEQNPFGDRQIFYFKTAELVASSIAVLMHCSFSISFPILFDKPVCLIANKALLQATEIRSNIGKFSIAFKKDIVDTDYAADVSKVLTPIDEAIRKKYIDTFFDTSIKESNGRLLAQHIESIHETIVNKISS